jgi:hypothetical protein
MLTVSGVTVITDWPLWVGSATDVAVSLSVMDVVDGSPVGGVYVVDVLGPGELIAPHGAPLQPVPDSCQVTFRLWPGTAGDNVAVTGIAELPACTEVVLGLSATVAGL